MNHHVKMLILVSATALTLPACGLLKKAATGGKISSNDLVNEADSQYQANEREKEQIVRLEGDIKEDLVEIETLRKDGRFSSAEYRVKTMNKRLAELKKLDGKNAMLTSAPKKLGEIESTWTEEVYNKNVLTKKCSELAESSKASRMEENWYRVNSSLEDYAKCRRKLVDVGVGEDVIAQSDAVVVPEFEAYFEYLITQAFESRKAKDFYKAVGFEKTLEGQVKYYLEAKPSADKSAEALKKMKTNQMKYRDPKEVEAEQAKGAFEAWQKQAAGVFNQDWVKIQRAEEAAKPLFDEGKAAMESGDAKTAETKLIAARGKLFTEAYPSAVALDAAIQNGSVSRGLSYEISSALARIYFESGEKAKLYPELSIIKEGRAWLSKDEEEQVRLYEILADRTGKLVPKPTEPVIRYASRYSDTSKTYKGVKELADARIGEAYNMLGVAMDTITHRQASLSTEEKAGQVVFMEEPVDDVKGGKLYFDFRREYEVPVKCWRTNKVAGVNLYTGVVYYEEKCKYEKRKDGYFIVVDSPKGVKVGKGDIVSFYAAVGKKSNANINLDNAGFVRVAPKGTTAWFMGNNVK